MIDNAALELISTYRGCKYPNCIERAINQCDNCDNYFCSDHGSAGGDREIHERLVAVPSACWECGGFNIDQ